MKHGADLLGHNKAGVDRKKRINRQKKNDWTRRYKSRRLGWTYEACCDLRSVHNFEEDQDIFWYILGPCCNSKKELPHIEVISWDEIPRFIGTPKSSEIPLLIESCEVKKNVK